MLALSAHGRNFVYGLYLTSSAEGIVRLIRFGVCGLMRWRFSGGKLMPFSERCRSVLLEDIAAVEMAVLVKVVVDRGVEGGKLL